MRSGAHPGGQPFPGKKGRFGPPTPDGSPHERTRSVWAKKKLARSSPHLPPSGGPRLTGAGGGLPGGSPGAGRGFLGGDYPPQGVGDPGSGVPPSGPRVSWDTHRGWGALPPNSGTAYPDPKTVRGCFSSRKRKNGEGTPLDPPLAFAKSPKFRCWYVPVRDLENSAHGRIHTNI